MNYLILLLSVILCSDAFARERDFDFRRERPRWRGNEHSERVHRVGLGRLTFAGRGCPDGSMRVVMAPDNLSFSILFDHFVAQVGAGIYGADQMACDAVIPIELPENRRMEITRVDFRGFISLPMGSFASLVSMFNFQGPGGDRDRMNMRFRFSGPVMDNYEISTDTMRMDQDSEISPCGGTVNLRVRNTLRIMSRMGGAEAAQVTIDSIDGSGNAIYYVNWRACDQNVDRPRGPRRWGR